MRVRVYVLEEGEMDVLVEASPGKGRSPILLKGITPENVVDQVGPVIEDMRRSREVQPRLLP